MNQGSISSLFSLPGIYVAVLFYFKFNEVISVSKIIGILMFIPCVILLSMDPKEVDEAAATATEEEMRLYGIVAVIFGLVAPFFWVFGIYYIRLMIQERR